jgi:hypothetical protein
VATILEMIVAVEEVVHVAVDINSDKYVVEKEKGIVLGIVFGRFIKIHNIR